MNPEDETSHDSRNAMFSSFHSELHAVVPLEAGVGKQND
jgi:hypothetical protein